jgi:hypothetical protein
MNVDGVAITARPPTTDNAPSPQEDVQLDDPSEDTDDALVPVATVIEDSFFPTSPLGKRKERSARHNGVAQRQRRAEQLQHKAQEVLEGDGLEVDHEDEEPITTPNKGKTGDNTNRWLELIEERGDNRLQLEEIVRARVNTVFPIIYCTNNKDIHDIANWAPCIMRKVRSEQYELLALNEHDKVDEDLDWKGDDGLSTSWSLYYKYPHKEFLDAYRENLKLATIDMDAHEVSPHRNSLRKKAAENVQKRADETRKAVLERNPTLVFKLGDIVMVPLDDVDRTKVDGANLIGVVVTINKLNATCRVAVKQGILKRAYAYHVIKPVPAASNNLDAMDLREAYEGWRSLPRLTEREAARYISSVGGQGMLHCNCKGTCTTGKCTCKAAGRLCSSRCHKNSKTCKNKTDDKILVHGK